MGCQSHFGLDVPLIPDVILPFFSGSLKMSKCVDCDQSVPFSFSSPQRYFGQPYHGSWWWDCATLHVGLHSSSQWQLPRLLLTSRLVTVVQHSFGNVGSSQCFLHMPLPAWWKKDLKGLICPYLMLPSCSLNYMNVDDAAHLFSPRMWRVATHALYSWGTIFLLWP